MNELLNLVKCCEYGNLTAINGLKFPWQKMKCGLEAEEKKNQSKPEQGEGKKTQESLSSKEEKRCQLK